MFTLLFIVGCVWVAYKVGHYAGRFTAYGECADALTGLASEELSEEWLDGGPS